MTVVEVLAVVGVGLILGGVALLVHALTVMEDDFNDVF